MGIKDVVSLVAAIIGVVGGIGGIWSVWLKNRHDTKKLKRDLAEEFSLGIGELYSGRGERCANVYRRAFFHLPDDIIKNFNKLLQECGVSENQGSTNQDKAASNLIISMRKELFPKTTLKSEDFKHFAPSSSTNKPTD